jgi:hypothetical protein
MATQLAECQNLRHLLRGHGRGPGGQPISSQLPEGRCPVPGCGEEIDRTRLMCRRDWYHIPKRLRDQVWRTWRSGQQAHSQQHQGAIVLAIAAARIARLRESTVCCPAQAAEYQGAPGSLQFNDQRPPQAGPSIRRTRNDSNLS